MSISYNSLSFSCPHRSFSAYWHNTSVIAWQWVHCEYKCSSSLVYFVYSSVNGSFSKWQCHLDRRIRGSLKPHWSYTSTSQVIDSSTFWHWPFESIHYQFGSCRILVTVHIYLVVCAIQGGMQNGVPANIYLEDLWEFQVKKFKWVRDGTRFTVCVQT